MAKNYFYNLLLTLANILFPILSFPYVSRILGPEGIGKVQFAFSFSQYFGMIAGFGIPIYGMKEIARHRDELTGRSKVFSELTAIYLLTSMVLSVFYMAAVYIFPYFKAEKDLFNIALLMVLLGCTYIEWVYTGMEEFKSIALRSAAFKIMGLIAMYVLIKQPSDYKIYLCIMIFSFLGNNILSFFLLRGKVQFILSGLQLRRHLRPLILIWGTTLVAVMADLDTVLIGFLSDNKAVGFYTAAVKLSKISIPVITSMSVVLMPKVAKYFADGELDSVQTTLDKAFKFVVFFGVPIAFGLALLAPDFITLFSGKEFVEATTSMRVLSLLPLVMGFSHFFLFLILVPAGRNREMFISEFIGLVISLALNFALIPYFRQNGSAVADIFSETCIIVLYFYFITRRFKFSFRWSLILKAAVSSLAFVPIIILFKELSLSLIYKLTVSVAGCTMVYVLIQSLIFKNDFVSNAIELIKMKLKTEKA